MPAIDPALAGFTLLLQVVDSLTNGDLQDKSKHKKSKEHKKSKDKGKARGAASSRHKVQLLLRQIMTQSITLYAESGSEDGSSSGDDDTKRRPAPAAAGTDSQGPDADGKQQEDAAGGEHSANETQSPVSGRVRKPADSGTQAGCGCGC